MVDKLRKAGLWIWLFKERIILIVMVCALGFQVYKLLNPPPPEAGMVLRSPAVTFDAATVDPSIVPPPPPPLPPDVQGGPYTGLENRNPFWYYSSTGDDARSNDIPADLIQLVRIRRVGDTVRAQLKTRATTRWYNQGEQFEEFVLESINEEAGTVTVFVQSYGRPLELSAQS